MQKGRIINLNGGVYKVLLDDGNVISVKARGKLRFSKKSIINEMFRKRCRQKKLLTLLFFIRTVCQSVKQREKAHTFGERYTPCVRKM